VRNDRAEPSDSADRIEPADANEPIEKAETAEPIEPSDSTEPADPIDSTDPLQPMHSTESSDHSDSVEFTDRIGGTPTSLDPRGVLGGDRVAALDQRCHQRRREGQDRADHHRGVQAVQERRVGRLGDRRAQAVAHL
jgi:hypothetical protein